jgi:DNA segregation ATPase FtsK/SpoIIIE, S-DNA-T family
MKSEKELVEINKTLKDILNELKKINSKKEARDIDVSSDNLYATARQVAIENKKVSAPLLQRKLRVGYARAARLLDMLEDKGVVGPADGAKPREVHKKDNQK